MKCGNTNKSIHVLFHLGIPPLGLCPENNTDHTKILMHRLYSLLEARCMNSCMEGGWGVGGRGTAGGWPPALRREPALGSPGKGAASASTHSRFPVPARAGPEGPSRVRRGGQWSPGRAQKEQMPDTDAAPPLCASPPHRPPSPFLPNPRPPPPPPRILPSLHHHLGEQAAPGEGRGLQ